MRSLQQKLVSIIQVSLLPPQLWQVWIPLKMWDRAAIVVVALLTAAAPCLLPPPRLPTVVWRSSLAEEVMRSLPKK